MKRETFAAGVALAAAASALVGVGCSSGSHHSGGFVSSSAPASTTPSSTTPSSGAPSTGAPQNTVQSCWPIVFVHGFGGFKNLGPVEYWWHIPEDLQAHGFQVYVASDTSVSTVQDRAQELENQIIAQFPDPNVKVNLIGHSMGGLDCRYLVSSLGFANRVASVTTIGTPHRGSSVADVIFGLVPGSIVDATNVLMNLVGYDLNGGREMTTSYMQGTFNPANPDAPGVAYFSWAGVADPGGSQTGCAVQPYLVPTWEIVSNVEGPNDGLVSVASAQWGTFQGTIPADHYNEVGQPLGAMSFDYLKFYEDWATELQARGFGP
jgi:triacylglycerol lipase